jgi:hypothetical protein
MGIKLLKEFHAYLRKLSNLDLLICVCGDH